MFNNKDENLTLKEKVIRDLEMETIFIDEDKIAEFTKKLEEVLA